MSLPDAGSVYVDVESMDWQPTRFPGIRIRILWQDETTGAYTAMFQVDPGARLPKHRHVGVEQTYVLEGSLVDDEGVCTAGNFVWRHPQSVHSAHSPDGCLAIGIFQQPNEFLDDAPPA